MAGEILLVVDDSEIIRNILAEIFRDIYTVVEAASGEEALERLDEYKNHINAVLLDINMVGMSGLDALQKMKEKPYFRDTAVVMITASQECADQVLAFKAGADDYITKPFNAAIVRARVNNVMSSRQRLRNIQNERETYRYQSELDQMTNLYNKATCQKMISNALEEVSGELNALMFIDIDHFKHINDHEGHLIGDHTIKIVADLLSSRFRDRDIVGRMGGDEFIIFMRDIPNRDIARTKANDLVRLLKFKPNISLPANISVSIGLTFIDKPTDFNTACGQADEALYAAKNKGRARMAEYGVCEINPLRDESMRHVCLVTRSMEIHKEMERALEGVGDLFEATSVPDLKAQLTGQSQKFDAVFIDVSETNGAETEAVWKSFTEIESLQNIPHFVFFTEGNMEQIVASVKYSPTDVISIPIDPEGLARKVNRWLK